MIFRGLMDKFKDNMTGKSVSHIKKQYEALSPKEQDAIFVELMLKQYQSGRINKNFRPVGLGRVGRYFGTLDYYDKNTR